MPDNAELQQGEFMRYFMEALWYPTALLPSQGVRWEAGEVAWVTPDGIKPYYRGKLTSLSFEYVNPG